MDVFCFDFDGVICDSAPETAVTAWRGCRELWPQAGSEPPAPLLERFCRLRPVMHTGYEAIPLMRLIELGGADDAAIFEGFPALRDALVKSQELDTKRLQAIFGAIRDRQIEQDRAQWLGWNRFYPGTAELLNGALARDGSYVITTKQHRFAMLLLEHHGIALPAASVYGLEDNRPKPEILADLLGRAAHRGATFHFIEDRPETLDAVIAHPALGAVRLYLADWGYNTPRQREAAARQPRIRVVSLAQFKAATGL
jgi:phosphoglycolate phosphatase-like HAD superfamily hydrolase